MNELDKLVKTIEKYIMNDKCTENYKIVDDHEK